MREPQSSDQEYVLVDSSVWIEFFKKGTTLQSEVLDELLELNQVAICGLIHAEIVSGSRTDAEFKNLDDYLMALPHIENKLSQVDLWNEIGWLRYRLKKNGRAYHGIPDLMIASIAKQYNYPIFTLDRGFEDIKNIYGVSLYARRAAK